MRVNSKDVHDRTSSAGRSRTESLGISLAPSPRYRGARARAARAQMTRALLATWMRESSEETREVTASHRGGDPLLELLPRHRADLARGHLAGLENHQRRDRLDAVLRRGLRIFIHVELDDLHLAVERARDLLERRGDHATGAAPLGPKIDHHRFGRLEHLA